MPVMSQPETILTIEVAEWQQDVYNHALFEDFEAEHPGTKVVLVFDQPNGFYVAPEADDDQIKEGLDTLVEYASKADVLQARSFNLSIETTRAGLYLDLAPLISNDPDFDISDFPTAVWESYQWDRGIWAIPVSYNAQFLIYDAKKFDELGLAYPTPDWTLTDLANAARELAVKDDEGNVTIPGLTGFDTKYLVVSLTGTPFLDQTIVPNEPLLDSPELQAFIDEWGKLADEGVFQSYGNFDNNLVPLAMDYSWRLQNFGGPEDADHDWQGTLLPGGHAGLDVTGYAVSAGTANPELAYELVKYITTRPEITGQLFGESPARKSMIGVKDENAQFTPPDMDEEVRALMDDAGENGITVADIQFSSHLSQYLDNYPDSGDGSEEQPEPKPLADIQQSAIDLMAKIETLTESQVLVVATPVPTPVIQEGEVVINFRLNVPYSPLPNRDAWDEFVKEFVANDPEIGNIDLVTGFGGPAPEESQPDCTYNTTNQVQSADLSTLMSLDPFMDADPDFDKSDVMGTTLQQLQRENATWAYPMVLQPQIISYDTNLFKAAGVDEPSPDWTIDEFIDIAQQLMDSDADIEYAFENNDFGPSYLYMLMAAYGGVPVDYSTTPPTVNLADPTTIDAARQVLDLAKEGYIRYQQLDNITGGGGGGFINNIPMRATSFTSLSYNLSSQLSGDASSEFVDPNRYIMYPRGTT
ncbi:MAG TPA: extracellular solute-binding protein, partial [Phototrophicaceae bacterium]|nr:extracellular solute-binding protein [Phototrophicaceae bacterium]